MEKWLDKYVPKAQNGIEGTMGGLTDKGFNYNGAWGGTMQDGGNIPVPMSPEVYKQMLQEYKKFYTTKVPLRPIRDDGFDAFYLHKTQGLPKVEQSEGSGWLVEDEEFTQFYPSEKGLPMPKKIAQKKGKKTFVDDYKTLVDNPLKDYYHRAIHSIVEDANKNQIVDQIVPSYKKMQKGGSLPGAVGFTYARTAGAAPANGPYAKKTKASAQNGMEMKFYQEGLDFTPKTISQDGTVIDPMGYWNPENVGNPVIIPSNVITMEGVDQPLIGISDEGDVQYMEPGENYEFEGESVLELPVARGGVSVNKADEAPIKKLDQLLNFTNYNKPTRGGWLDKYN